MVTPGEFRLAEKRGGKRNRPFLREKRRNWPFSRKKGGILHFSSKKLRNPPFIGEDKEGSRKSRTAESRKKERNWPFFERKERNRPLSPRAERRRGIRIGRERNSPGAKPPKPRLLGPATLAPGEFRLAEKRGGKRNRPFLRGKRRNWPFSRKKGGIIHFSSRKRAESAFYWRRQGGIAKIQNGGIAEKRAELTPFRGKRAESALFPEGGKAERNPHWPRAEFPGGKVQRRGAAWPEIEARQKGHFF